jgi:uncharacterized protein YjbJ (UPF0337 family)
MVEVGMGRRRHRENTTMDEKRDDHRDEDLKRKGFADSAKGKADEVKGHIKDAAGGLTGDRDLQIEGKIDQVKGKVKDAIGKAERKLDETSHRFADDADKPRGDDDF